MDRNAFLAFALSFLVLSLWMMWEAEHRPPPRRVEPTPSPLAAAPAPPSVVEAPPAATPVQPLRPAAQAQEQRLRVETDLVRAELSSHGAGVTRWELRRYALRPGDGSPAVELSMREGNGEAVLATPLRELGLGDLSRAAFSVRESGPLHVDFVYTDAGITIRKRYLFERDSYAFRLRLEVSNESARGVEPRFDVTWPTETRAGADFSSLSLTALHDGELEQLPVEGFGRAGFGARLFGGGIETERVFASGVEWAGIGTRYFLGVVLPDVPRDTEARFLAEEPGKRARATVSTGVFSIPPGRSVEREFRVYMGPKEPARLAELGAHLERSIDLGWSWVAPITRGFTWLLHALYAVIPNYGLVIIVITILVRLATAPLATKQMRSMKRLGELQPKIRALQEKHRDDRQQQSQEMMKLYRESGVNPLGGCLPMVLQIPVFIALYYALQSSIDLRQAPFVGWIQDLSQPETLFTVPGLELPVRLLPVLMGASMVLQQKLTPTTMDPAQARMLMVMMPIMFTVLFYTFPSGLVLYWFVSNLLAIGQQLLINRGLERARA